jgi:hypothetical protein
MPMHLIITFDDDYEIDLERLDEDAAEFDQLDLTEAITALAEVLSYRIIGEVKALKPESPEEKFIREIFEGKPNPTLGGAN